MARARAASRRPPRAAASSSRRGCRSIRSGSAREWLDPARAARRCCARPTRSGSRARTAGRRATPCAIPFVPRDALPIDTRDELGRGGDRAALPRPRRRARPRLRGGRSACGARSAATTSPTSSRATSSTRTSATSAAASARSRRASSPRTCAGRRTSCRTRRSCAACVEAWERGATEVCLQGGIHPASRRLLRRRSCGRSRTRCPDMHVHAFSALEIWQGAATLGAAARRLPRAAARRRSRARCRARRPRSSTTRCARVICPDKVTTAQWLEVHDTAHRRRPALERHDHVRARRRAAQLGAAPARACASSSSEAAASPSSCRCRSCTWRRRCTCKGRARRGPTFGEALLMHAVGRLALHPWITNIQASWVKLGPRRRRGRAARRRERSRRHADERVDLPRRGRRARAGDAAGGDGGADPRERPATTPAHDALRGCAARAEAASFGAPPCVEPINPPVREAGLKAPSRLVRPGFAVAQPSRLRARPFKHSL